MAHINIRTHSAPCRIMQRPLLGLALLSACATPPNQPPKPSALPAYRLPFELEASAQEFKTPLEILGFNFFTRLHALSGFQMFDFLAVPNQDGAFLIANAPKPEMIETRTFPMANVKDEFGPHAEPLQKAFNDAIKQIRIAEFSDPTLPAFEVRCFVFPYFEGTSLEAVSMKGFVLAFELRAKNASEPDNRKLKPKVLTLEELAQKYLDNHGILLAKVMMRGSGEEELRATLKKIEKLK